MCENASKIGTRYCIKSLPRFPAYIYVCISHLLRGSEFQYQISEGISFIVSCAPEVQKNKKCARERERVRNVSNLTESLPV